MNTRIEGRTVKRIRLWSIKAAARGFTVLELMVTVAIIGIVAGIAIPTFNRMAVNGNLRTAARDIMGDIANLKEGAMAQNTQYSMIFNTGTNSYTLPLLPGGTLATKSPASLGQGIQLTGVAFGAGSTITFLTRGTLSQGGNVVLTNSRGSTATITCNISGRTYVQFVMH
jgi:prepilin-type N-terminal cleavage/methylation domain-containing protein